MHEYKLPSSITIANCDEILNSIAEVKENNQKVLLDSSDVETIDTAAIQLICSLALDEEQVSHVNMSEKVKDAMTCLGIPLI